MKGRGFLSRLGFALSGWRTAWRDEKSFRTQTLAAGATVLATAFIAPAPFWWGMIAISIALVLAAELFNTALEKLADGLHPEQAEFIAQAKDCAAGAVLVFSVSAVVVFLLMLFDQVKSY